MTRLTLITPTESYREQILAYRAEFLQAGDYLAGCAGLDKAPSFGEWLQALRDNSREETVREGLVPASNYMAIRQADNRLVGFIDLRHRLNEFLLQFGGNIGYSVRPCERRQGYAKEMLTLALLKCRERGMRRVLVTCRKENFASARTIQSCGGVLENEGFKEGTLYQRYWITLSPWGGSFSGDFMR